MRILILVLMLSTAACASAPIRENRNLTCDDVTLSLVPFMETNAEKNQLLTEGCFNEPGK